MGLWCWAALILNSVCCSILLARPEAYCNTESASSLSAPLAATYYSAYLIHYPGNIYEVHTFRICVQWYAMGYIEACRGVKKGQVGGCGWYEYVKV